MTTPTSSLPICTNICSKQFFKAYCLITTATTSKSIEVLTPQCGSNPLSQPIHVKHLLALHHLTVLGIQETTVAQRISHRLSNASPARGDEEVQKGTNIKGSRHGDVSLLKPTGIQIATKFLPGPTTRKHRELIGVKTMSLGANYSFYCLTFCQYYFRILVTSYRVTV